MPDNRTLVQMQPLYRVAPGAPILALYHQGGPDPFPWTVGVTLLYSLLSYISFYLCLDVLGGGALGAHGGSGLSSVGGTIRLGELLPDAPPITHALKLEFYAHEYYHYGTADSCYSWPATGCDGYAATVYNGSNQYHYNCFSVLFLLSILFFSLFLFLFSSFFKYSLPGQWNAIDQGH